MRQVEGHDDPPFTTDSPEFLLTLDLRSEMAQAIWDTPRPPGLKARREQELLRSLLRTNQIISEPDDLVTEQQPLRSSLWGRADASDEQQEEARTAVGHTEPTAFNPREHSTPSLYPRFSHGEGTMLLGRKVIRFTTPDQDNLKATPSRDDVIGGYSTPSRHSIFSRAAPTPNTSSSKKLFFKTMQVEKEANLDEESPPAWVIRDTQIPNTRTMGPTRTTFPDMNNGEVVQEVGDRRDKGKGRDTGYVKSTERLGQSMPSVPRQGDWTAAGADMNDMKGKSREMDHGMSAERRWQQIFPIPEQAGGNKGKLARQMPTAPFVENIQSPNLVASEANQSDAPTETIETSHTETSPASISGHTKSPEEHRNSQQTSPHSEPPSTSRTSHISTTSSHTEGPSVRRDSQNISPPRLESEQPFILSRQFGVSSPTETSTADPMGAPGARLSAQRISPHRRESEPSMPLHSLTTSHSKATTVSDASGRTGKSDVGRDPRQISPRRQERDQHSSLRSPASNLSEMTPTPIASGYVVASDRQALTLPSSMVPGAPLHTEASVAHQPDAETTPGRRSVSFILPDSTDEDRSQWGISARQLGNTTASTSTGGEQDELLEDEHDELLGGDISIGRADTLTATSVRRTSQESVLPEAGIARRLDAEREESRSLSAVLSRAAYSSGPLHSRSQTVPPSPTTEFHSRTPEAPSTASGSRPTTAFRSHESEPALTGASGSRATETLRSRTEESPAPPSRVPFSRWATSPYEIPGDREGHTGRMSAPPVATTTPSSGYDVGSISAPLPTLFPSHLRTSHTLKALPGLFDGNGPVTQTSNGVHKLPDTFLMESSGEILFNTSVLRFQHDKVKSMSTRWTVSQWATNLQFFTISDSAPGDLHFHRNSLGVVDIWVNISFTVWLNCTHSWLLYDSEPILHPRNSNLILDSWGTNSWIPNYIAKSTYSRRKRSDRGLVGFNASL